MAKGKYEAVLGSKAPWPSGAGGKTGSIDTYAQPAKGYKGGAGAKDPSRNGKSAEGSGGSAAYKGRHTEVLGKSASSAPPALGFVASALHSHLGHFAGADVLKHGHNTMAYVAGRGGSVVSKNVDKISARRAKREIRAGNTTVANERPVLAAKVARRAAVKAADPAAVNAAQAAIKSARNNPNAARQERKSRRSVGGTPTMSNGY
jgi:hypothetical protein